MEKPFFAMLYNQSGTRLVPMADPEGELMMYPDIESATTAAEHTLYGSEFGYDIYKAGFGELNQGKMKSWLVCCMAGTETPCKGR